ncbi:MAG: sensor domain-containing protein [Acidobacteria bacterium]|nr:sensor domain-containing protein [Acidobacteriota bacterium]
MSKLEPESGFFAPALSPRAYGALLYQIAGLPLAMAAFVWVIVGVPLSLGLSFIGIGLLLGLAYLLASRGLAVAQGRLAAWLVGVDGPTAPPLPEANGFWARLGALLKDPASWGAQAFLLLRMPLGVLGFAMVLTLLLLSVVALGVGLLPWQQAELLGDGSVFFGAPSWSGTVDLGSHSAVEWFVKHPGPIRVTAGALGFVGLLSTLHAAVALTRAEARAACALLRRRSR